MRRLRFLRHLGALSLGLLLACSQGLAQEADSSKQKHDGKLHDLLARLLKRLDLSDAKRQAVRTVLEAHQETVSSIFTREIEARASLRDAVERRQTTEQDVSDALATLAEVDVDLALERAEVASELFALLNEDQRVKMIRFLISLERQIVARERETALPVRKVARLQNLSDEEKAQIEAVFDEAKPAVASAANSLDGARIALLVVMLESQPDRGLVRTAAESASAAAKKLARAKARAWSGLLGALGDKQRDKLKAYTQTLDEQVVKRHETACLFFLEQL